MASLATALPDEIVRVSRLRDEYIALRSMPNVIVEPQIAMMAEAIEAATRALGSGDVFAMLQAYENLRGYEG